MYVSLMCLLLLLAVRQVFGAAMPAPCMACRADFDAMRAGYSAHDWQALTHGDIVTSRTEQHRGDGSAEDNVQSSAILPYPPAQVWSVITDAEARSRIIPGVKAVRMVRQDGNRVWVAYHLRFFLVNIRYQVINTLDPERGTISWTLDKSAEHDIADTTGAWQVAPLPSGEGTLVRYRAWIDTGHPVPGFLADFFTRRSLPKVLEGLRREMERRFQH